MSKAFYDVFISYGRADSKAFAIELCQELTQRSLKVWLDQQDIPLAVDFQNQIIDGIEKSHNFLFVISPHAVNSKYCRKEIDLALQCNKRIIPLLHVEQISRKVWQQRFPEGSDQEWADACEKGSTSCFPNMHPAIAKINWVYFREKVDDYKTALTGLVDSIRQQEAYVYQHTELLVRALNWARSQKQSQYLLTGEAQQQAETWLKIRFQDCQPPCLPTDLHCEFITESIKNAHNLMTQVFLAYAEENQAIAKRIRITLQRHGFTVWANTTDIPAGANFQSVIDHGIEEADNIVYLVSAAAIHSSFCQHEVEYALLLKKRIIPILIEDIFLENLPFSLQNLQYINLTQQPLAADQGETENQLIKILKQDASYHEEHKILLVKALKWERQHRNSSILLRGYNLRHAEAWLKVAKARNHYPPTLLQETFIIESLRHPPQFSLDVFISYSRADSDFARKLNDALQLQGKTTWFDQESIAAGADFQQEIYQGITCSDNFLFILSPRSLSSPYCCDEVAYAAKQNKRMITVLCQPIHAADLPAELAAIQWIDFCQTDRDFYDCFTQLIRTLDVDRDYVHSHTRWSQKAIEWKQQQKNEDLLLRGTELAIANTWLQEAQSNDHQPHPTPLQKSFIQASEVWRTQEVRAHQRRRACTTTALTVGLVMTSSLAGLAWWQSRRSALNEIAATAKSSQLFFASDNSLDALVQAMRANRRLRRVLAPSLEAQNEVRAALWQSVYGMVEINRLEGHEAWVWDVAFSPKGNFIATTSSDETIKVWQSDGSLVDTLEAHDGDVRQVVFSADEQTMASVGNDGRVNLWTPQGKLLKTLKTDSQYLFGIALSPDGQTIISAGSGQTVQIWRRDGTLRQTLEGHQATVLAVAMSADGQTIVSVDEDGRLNLWTIDGTLQQSIPAHKAEIFGVAFSPDGQTIATASKDQTVKLWSLDGVLLHDYTEHQAQVNNVAFSSDGKLLASVASDHSVRVWQPDGFTLATFVGHQEEVWGIAFSPDDKFVATASGDRTVKLWKLENPLFLTLRQHTDEIWGVALSPDGKTLASASRDQTVKLWSSDGVFLNDLGESEKTHEEAIRAIAFSPDGQYMASASWDKTAKLWSREVTLLATLGHEDHINNVAFSPDSQVVATASSDGTAKLWSQEGEFLQLLEEQSYPIYSIAFSPDNQRIATASYDGKAKIWTRSGDLIAQLTDHEKTIGEIVFSPDGERIATASWDNTVKLWSKEGELITTLEEHTNGVSDVAFSPNGRWLATASWDKTVKLWDREGLLLRTFTNHTGQATSVAFSPNSQTLASAGTDRTVILWNLEQMLQIDPSKYGCSWIRDYLQNNPNVSEANRSICD